MTDNWYSDSIPIVMLKLFETGWNYSQDGPGNRLILHLQGCNFACPWCSNPEGRSAKGELFIRPELLTEEACSHGAVSEGALDREICRECRDRECLHRNRNRGIRFTAREYSLPDLVAMAVDSKPLFFDGGGVTLTGGEATLQFEGVKALLSELKKAGIHTALETNGSHPRLEELLPQTDLLIFDLKHWDFSLAREVLKNRGAHVLENLRKVSEIGGDILLRVTVIPGFNSSFADMEQFADLIASLPRRENRRVELLYYHSYGREKWEAIGREYRGPDEMVGESEKSQYREIFASRGLNIINT